jgi:hypothetical protein
VDPTRKHAPHTTLEKIMHHEPIMVAKGFFPCLLQGSIYLLYSYSEETSSGSHWLGASPVYCIDIIILTRKLSKATIISGQLPWSVWSGHRRQYHHSYELLFVHIYIPSLSICYFKVHSHIIDWLYMYLAQTPDHRFELANASSMA